MKEQLDLVKILKDCPKETKFYSPVFGEIEFIRIEKFNEKSPIVIKWFINNSCYIEYLTKDGKFRGLGECIIFPSKDQRDWNKWQRPFVDGDIVFYNNTIAIFKEWGDETLFRTYVATYLCCDSFIDVKIPLFGKNVRKEIRFATEKEKEQLFQAIKDHGYKWNNITKTLEKLIEPKFKVGDIIQSKNDSNHKFTITNIDNNEFYCGCEKNGYEKYLIIWFP